MVYLLNATPRAVDAVLATPGQRPSRAPRRRSRHGLCLAGRLPRGEAVPAPHHSGTRLYAGLPHGSQSTYDRALRCVFGGDDSQLEGGWAGGRAQRPPWGVPEATLDHTAGLGVGVRCAPSTLVLPCSAVHTLTPSCPMQATSELCWCPTACCCRRAGRAQRSGRRSRCAACWARTARSRCGETRWQAGAGHTVARRCALPSPLALALLPDPYPHPPPGAPPVIRLSWPPRNGGACARRTATRWRTLTPRS